MKPQYKIHGHDRKQLKNKLSQMKSFLKHFWYYHQMDKDMALVFKSNKNNYPMSDDKAKLLFDQKQKVVEQLETKLNVRYE